MLKISSLNLNGSSRIDNSDVVWFSASVSEDSSNYSITKNVANREVYKQNKVQCEADYEEFEAKVEEYINA